MCTRMNCSTCVHVATHSFRALLCHLILRPGKNPFQTCFAVVDFLMPPTHPPKLRMAFLAFITTVTLRHGESWTYCSNTTVILVNLVVHSSFRAFNFVAAAPAPASWSSSGTIQAYVAAFLPGNCTCTISPTFPVVSSVSPCQMSEITPYHQP